MSGTKIKKLNQLKIIISRLRKKGKRAVFTNGCFDILHYGHVQYLEKAQGKGDLLIVGLNSDKSVRNLKGKNRPIVNELDRAGVLAGLTAVDYITIFNEDTPLETIKALKPDVLIKGADWDAKQIVGGDFVLKNGGRVLTVELSKGRSTTNIIKKIQAKLI